MVRLELGAPQHLDVDHGDGPEQGGGDDQQSACVDLLQPRPQDDEGPEKPDENCRPPAPAECLAQEQRAEKRREQRSGESERRRARDRRHRQADEEAHHRDRVDDGAHEMQAEFLRVKQRRPVAHQQRRDHEQPEQVAEEGNLQPGQMLGGVPDRRMHGGKHQRAEHHQQAAPHQRRGAPIPSQHWIGENQGGEGAHPSEGLPASRPVNKAAPSRRALPEA